jgi:hypothetical protein
MSAAEEVVTESPAVEAIPKRAMTLGYGTSLVGAGRSFKDIVLPTVLSGIKINTNETNSLARTQLQLIGG